MITDVSTFGPFIILKGELLDRHEEKGPVHALMIYLRNVHFVCGPSPPFSSLMRFHLLGFVGVQEKPRRISDLSSKSHMTWPSMVSNHLGLPCAQL